jgi:hypothetical protein
MPGPLNKLIKSKSLTNLYYPLDLGSSRKGHYIMFTACVPLKSTYQSKGGTSVATAVSPNSAMSGIEKGLNAVSSVASKATAAVGGAFDTVNAAASGAVSAVSGALGSVDAVASTLSGAASKLSDTASLASNFLNNPTATLSDVQNTLTGAVDTASNAVSGVSSLAKDIGNYFSSGSASSALRAGLGSLNSGWQNLLSPPVTKPVAYIQLYMPDTVNVNQQMMYKSLDMTEALGKLGIGAEGAAEGASILDKIKNSDSTIGAIKSIASSAPPGIIESMGRIGESVGIVKSGDDVARFALNKAGNAINPQMEVVFTQINFREFQFHFTFTPKSAREAKSVREIIKSFRLHGAPELDKSSSGRYFITPSTFNIDYIFNGDYNPNLHHFQPCVLTSIQVDYAQDVGWVAFEDGMPVKTHMVLQFREIEILTKEHVDKGF